MSFDEKWEKQTIYSHIGLYYASIKENEKTHYFLIIKKISNT